MGAIKRPGMCVCVNIERTCVLAVLESASVSVLLLGQQHMAAHPNPLAWVLDA